MEAKKTVLTYQGLQELQAELDDLKTNRRRENAKKLQEAREQGDLSENAEYDAAKDEQRDIQARIEQIEELLKNVEVVDEDEANTDAVSIGCVVKVNAKTFGKEIEYKIVGSTEANSLKNKISNESPVGAALIGHKVGDTVEVVSEAGTLVFEILDINKSR